METGSLVLVGITLLLVVLFDFLNGFHDASNAIATIVSTRVLKPYRAVIWAASFNFLAYFLFGVHVAETVGAGIVSAAIIDHVLILSALIGAIFWNLLTWYVGIPSSSSHALIGALVGAALVKSGLGALQYTGLIKIIVSIFISPLLGMLIGLLCIFFIAKLFFYYTTYQTDRWFRSLQLLSSALLSLGHGGNDAQKSMGIIAIVLFQAGLLKGSFYVPYGVIILCYATIALGTLLGGYRIVRTMGMKITKLKPVGGCCAETGSALTLFLATALGIPVSTTHIVAGAIIGVGSLERFSAVRWGVAGQMLWAWLLTLPSAGVVAGFMEWILSHFFS